MDPCTSNPCCSRVNCSTRQVSCHMCLFLGWQENKVSISESAHTVVLSCRIWIPCSFWLILDGMETIITGHQQRQALNQFTHKRIRLTNDPPSWHLKCWKQYRSKHVPSWPASESPGRLNRKKIPGPHRRSAKSEPLELRTKESGISILTLSDPHTPWTLGTPGLGCLAKQGIQM